MLDIVPTEVVNPLIPAGYDVVFSVVPLVLAAAMIAALVSIIRRYRSMSVLDSFLWTAFIVFAPALGALIWFLMGRDRYELHGAVSARSQQRAMQ